MQANIFFRSTATRASLGRYATVETAELRIPLECGWKRETLVREYSKSGVRGDVVYYAPCGKKFKQYPDIVRVSGRCSQPLFALLLLFVLQMPLVQNALFDTTVSRFTQHCWLRISRPSLAF